MALHLYHHNSSVCAAKVRVALSEKRLAWSGTEMTLDGDQLTPDYLRLNPNAVVPTLVHDDVVVIESNVILEYLDDAFPEAPLRPESPGGKADMRLLLQRLDGDAGIHHATSVLTYGAAYRWRLIEEAGGLDRDRLGPVIDRRMNPKSRIWLEGVVYRGTESTAFRRALRAIDLLFGDFETRLAGQPWLSGHQYSLSDVAYFPYAVRFDLLGFQALFDGRPALRDWYERLCARNSASQVFDWYRPEYRETLELRGSELNPGLRALLDQDDQSDTQWP